MNSLVFGIAPENATFHTQIRNLLHKSKPDPGKIISLDNLCGWSKILLIASLPACYRSTNNLTLSLLGVK